jgi:tetratricopeptide (TPR) repeat protein
MMHDARGVAVSTDDPGSLAAYERATDLLYRYAGNPVAVIDEALARDPGFALGHAFKAAMCTMFTDRNLEPDLRVAVESGEAAARTAGARERMHLAAARAWLEGDYERAVDGYARIAIEIPRDVLALQAAHIGAFNLGRAVALRDVLARALHAWDDEVPGYGYVLGMYAFGLEENGDYARAEEIGRRAVELEARDVWASHAVAHVMEMQARLAEGIAWLEEGSRGWDPDTALACHNFWHLALYHLDAGDPASALALYDHRIHPQPTQVVLDLIDASALLWRMRLAGHEVGDRFEALADDWRARIEDGYLVFGDVHAMMAFTGAHRYADARALLAAVERHAGDAGSNGRMIREVGLPVCRALFAFGEGDHAAAVDLLLPVREIAARFGGSHAQRDVLSLTLLEAALRGGQGSVARALASERTRLRPGNPAAWIATARAAEAAGAPADAARAREQGLRLRARLSARRRSSATAPPPDGAGAAAPR